MKVAVDLNTQRWSSASSSSRTKRLCSCSRLATPALLRCAGDELDLRVVGVEHRARADVQPQPFHAGVEIDVAGRVVACQVASR